MSFNIVPQSEEMKISILNFNFSTREYNIHPLIISKPAEPEMIFDCRILINCIENISVSFYFLIFTIDVIGMDKHRKWRQFIQIFQLQRDGISLFALKNSSKFLQ